MIVCMKLKPPRSPGNLDRSLSNPHPESLQLAELGFNEWCLASGGDADGLVDESLGELTNFRRAFQGLRNEIEGKPDVRQR